MGALLHQALHVSRAWNRKLIPIKVYSKQTLDELTVAPYLAEIEYQLSQPTKISSHPAYFYLTSQTKGELYTFLSGSQFFIKPLAVSKYFLD